MQSNNQGLVQSIPSLCRDGYARIVRPTRWYNPIRIDGATSRQDAIQGFRTLLLGGRLPITVEDIRPEIGEPRYGVAYYCREDQNCYGDVILNVAYK